MSSNDPQVPWSEEQWATVKQTVQKEAVRARVAASFLPLVGPLSPDTDFVKTGELKYEPDPPPELMEKMVVDDRGVIVLATLQVLVKLRGAQVADPDLTSALEMFRRAANVVARLEDAIVFQGQEAKDKGPPAAAIQGLPAIWKVTSGSEYKGLFQWAAGEMGKRGQPDGTPINLNDADNTGRLLVQAISDQIGELESRGYYGPFAVALGKKLFSVAQDPNRNMVLPSDRIIPFLGGGPLLRASTLPDENGIVVALGAAPFELVIATDVSVGFLQVTPDPAYVFRVHEKMALRVKEPGAIALLGKAPPPPKAK